MERLKLYFLSTRPQFLTAIMLAVGLGTTTAWYTDRVFYPGYFILTVLAALFYHAGMNVLNDYFDFLNGTDNINEKALTPYTGGSRMIQNGLLTARETLALGAGLLLVGSLAGLYLAYERGAFILLLGVIGLSTGIFYTAPPLFLAGKGLGELTVGLNFGLLSTVGACYVQAGGVRTEALFASLPITFLITALLYINQFPDYEADRATGKRNIVVRLGPERARWGMVVITVLAYASLLGGILLGSMPALSLAALLSAVFAVPAVTGLFRNYDSGPALVPSIRCVILAHLSTGLLLMASHLL